MIKKIFLMILSMLLLLLCACGPGTGPAVSPGDNPTPEQTQTPEDPATPELEAARDYTYSWWPEAVGVSDDKPFCVQTGWYGFSINSVNGTLEHLGAVVPRYTQTQALQQNFQVISELPAVSAAAYAAVDGTRYDYTGTVEPAPNSGANTRMIESGQYMQSFDVAAMKLAAGGEEAPFVGRMEYKATPRYFALNLQMFAQRAIPDVEIGYSLTFPAGTTATLSGTRAAMIRFGATGLVVYLPDEKSSLSFDEATATLAIRGTVTLPRYSFKGLSIILIPTENPTEDVLAQYQAIESTTLSATQTAPREGRAAEVSFDAERGVWMIDTNRMNTASGGAFAAAKNRNAYDGLVFTLTNPSAYTVKVPVEFTKSGTFAVEGFAPMLRDVDTKEPVGTQVQISKNWHGGYSSEPKSSWYKGLDGTWYHGFTYLEVPAGGSVTYEYINAYNCWGTVNVASHAQLCLIGWPGHHTTQIWHTSTIGSNGESFCYDPDITCGYSFINDVRGVGFNPYEDSRTYMWGANNGGGNFLYYGKDRRSQGIVGMKNMKVFYKTYGPNLAEVIFSGVTQDNAVEFTLTTYLGRTNDVSRAIHSFEYRFLEDVTFERMAFYQIGADHHNSGRWHGLTLGNEDGPVEYEIDGVRYGAEAEIPVADSAGYVGGNGMQQIEIPGERLWIAFTDSYIGVNSDYMQSKNAARTLSLLFFEAELNGVHYDKPSVSLRSTEMFCGASTLAELNPPKEVGKTIKAGSTVKGAVEYINLPVSLKSVYYDSPVLKAVPAEEFDTWKLAYRYAMGDQLSATAQRGTLVRQYPIAVRCDTEQDGVLAELTVKGGISYIPLTFTNVPSYSGWRLQQFTDGAWVKVDQSVLGNDYWQTYYDPDTDTYELTFNVEHSGDPQAEYRYRLVKE